MGFWHMFSRRSEAVRFSVFVLVFYLFIRYSVLKIEDGTTVDLKKTQAEITEQRSIDDHNIINPVEIPVLHVESSPRCQVVYIAWKCHGREAAVNFFWSLKSLLYYRSSPLHLVMYVDDTARYTLETLFHTWDLPCVDVTLFTGTPKTLTSSVTIPNGVQKAIFLDVKMRFMSDITPLFEKFNSMTMKEQSEFYLPPEWRVSLTSAKEMTTSSKAKAFASEPLETQYIEDNAFLNSQIENLHNILKLDGNIYQQVPANLQNCTCAQKAMNNSIKMNTPDGYRNNSLHSLNNKKVITDKSNIFGVKDCKEFVHYAYSLKRTFLYYFGDRSRQYKDPVDVSLVTQLTFDRFHVLERFAQHWKGPMVVILYVSDTDAYKLRALFRGNFLNSRKNIDLHLLFKKKHLYPINELRNIGINQVKTAYTLFVDIDLLPNPDAYEKITNYIKIYLLGQTELKTLIVPAFEAFQDLNPFPSNRTVMLTYLNEKKVGGYKMWRGWNLGHKPTDYPKWIKTTTSYEVQWRDAYEPYVVVETKKMPQYEVALLERMGDKIAYGLELFARGYKFRVLHDVYVIHMPHPKSDSTSLWGKDRKYSGCCGKLFQAFKRDVFNQFPDKKY